jgi:hypothetical protein
MNTVQPPPSPTPAERDELLTTLDSIRALLLRAERQRETQQRMAVVARTVPGVGLMIIGVLALLAGLFVGDAP